MDIAGKEEEMDHILAVLWQWIEKLCYIVFVKILHIRILEKNWQAFMQFVKFGIVGVSNTLISYVSYLLFYFLGCHYLVASVLGFVISVTNSYYWNNKYVFTSGQGEKRIWWKVYIKTFLAYASTGLILANILLVIWVQLCNISEVVAPVLNLLITIPLNFIINKYWAYKKGSKH